MTGYNPGTTAASPNGRYIGFEEDGVVKFRGIPYAHVRRWERPVPSTLKQDDIFEAFRDGPCPWQATKEANIELLGSGGIAEDSLNLNIFTAGLSTQGKAVMVWITGGAQILGNNIGFISQSGKVVYDASTLVKENPDVIVITINYRLGFWGSVNLSCLDGYHSEYQYSNNLARLDILECLKWVKRNISSFGGNPDNITLFGQSAGSNNITSLLLMPEALPYFHKAICQSSFSMDISVTNLECSQRISAEFFKSLSVKTLSEALSKSNEEILSAQMDMVNRSMNGTSAFPDIESKFMSTVIDDVVIPRDYWEFLMSGAAKDKKIMLGTNSGEYDTQFSPFIDPSKWADAKEMVIKQNWGKLDPIRGSNPKVVAQYLLNNTTERDEFTAIKDLKNDIYLRVGAMSYALVLSQFMDTYLYYLTYEKPSEGRVRCDHGTEMGAIFDYDPLLPDALKKYVRRAWTNFARCGNPNSPNSECIWEKFCKPTFNTLLLNESPKTVPGIRLNDVDLLIKTFTEYKENSTFSELWEYRES